MSALERTIRSPDGRAIGELRAGPSGWWAALCPGSSSEDIDAAMDACEPIFARFAEARRKARAWRQGMGLRVVAGGKR